MEQAKKSTFKLLFYLKKNELKKNGNAPIMARITIDGTPKSLSTKLEINTEQKVTFHTARHTFRTMFLTEGVPLESLSKMMGHKNISTTKIYAKIISQKISKDMDLVFPKFAGMEAAFIEMEQEDIVIYSNRKQV